MAFTEKYVTVAGAGAHDGSTEGNAWTFSEMIAAAPAAGTRVNIKAGSYSEGATTLPANGTVLAPIVLRGYSATIGDLDNQGRGSDGMLNTANMPDFTITSAWTPSAFCFLQNLDIAGALSSYLITSTASDQLGFVSCRMVNSQNNASAGCLVADNLVILTNCDFSCTGASHATVVDIDADANVVGCTFKGALNTATLLSIDNGAVRRSVFLGMGNASKGITFRQGTAAFYTVDACTFYNLGTAIQWSNAASTSFMTVTNCHVTDCTKYLDNLYSATSDVAVVESNNRIRDVTTPRTGILSIVLASEVTTDAGDYTTDYISSTNLRLKSTAAGKSKGMMPYSDIGAYQCAYPTLPEAANVQSGAVDYGYADALLDPSYPSASEIAAAMWNNTTSPDRTVTE